MLSLNLLECNSLLVEITGFHLIASLTIAFTYGSALRSAKEGNLDSPTIASISAWALRWTSGKRIIARTNEDMILIVCSFSSIEMVQDPYCCTNRIRASWEVISVRQKYAERHRPPYISLAVQTINSSSSGLRLLPEFSIKCDTYEGKAEPAACMIDQTFKSIQNKLNHSTISALTLENGPYMNCLTTALQAAASFLKLAPGNQSGTKRTGGK